MALIVASIQLLNPEVTSRLLKVFAKFETATINNRAPNLIQIYTGFKPDHFLAINDHHKALAKFFELYSEQVNAVMKNSPTFENNLNEFQSTINSFLSRATQKILLNKEELLKRPFRAITKTMAVIPKQFFSSFDFTLLEAHILKVGKKQDIDLWESVHPTTK